MRGGASYILLSFAWDNRNLQIPSGVEVVVDYDRIKLAFLAGRAQPRLLLFSFHYSLERQIATDNK